MSRSDEHRSRPLLLVVDDERSIVPVIERFARQIGFDVEYRSNGRDALAALATMNPDVAMVDLQMPELTGIDVLRAVRAADSEAQVILMTGSATVDTAIEAVKAGALDYLSKPFDFERLGALLRGIKEAREDREVLLSADAAVAERLDFHGMIGRSTVMQELFTTIRRLAPHARTVLVTGETGTGKELVARALYREGRRRDKRFLTVNCSAVVETLFESELFGHVRGAFTGAHEGKVGVFEHAHGGTLFLDEAGELPLALQPKLLRAVEYGEVQRVGSLETRKLDVSVVAATNRDLRADVEAGRFRRDLFYRLSILEIHIPPLRARREDIPYLAAAFIREICERFDRPITGLTPAAEKRLQEASWPGNVRELRNAIERACLNEPRRAVDGAGFRVGSHAGQRAAPDIAARRLWRRRPALDRAARSDSPGVARHAGQQGRGRKAPWRQSPLAVSLARSARDRRSAVPVTRGRGAGCSDTRAAREPNCLAPCHGGAIVRGPLTHLEDLGPIGEIPSAAELASSLQ